MTPAELLRRHHLKPKKDWGQNFLGDARVLRDLAALSGAKKGDLVVELGAGLGHFTRALAATGAHVVAVERDRELAPILREELAQLDAEVIEADAKTFDLRPFVEKHGRPIILCGNLPYHLSSPILFNLMDQRRMLERAVLLLQREVAERVAEPPGSRDYGLLSVLVQHVADARIGLQVSRTYFTPPPDVESSVLVLDFLPELRAPVVDEKRFRVLVKAAFSQRRKTLWNAVKSVPGAREALALAGVDGQRRGETLTVAEFASIERAISATPPPES